jgi:peroxiredoxin Q/BCP
MKTVSAGSAAPDFELPDQQGTPTKLSTLLQSGPVVLFFYPGAMTGGCTKESCHFRDLKSEFESAGAQRVGISMDPIAKQKEFADQNSFDYPLLSDESGDVAVSYGVRRKYVSPVKRATFVIGTDQVIKEVITSEMNMEVHADQALESLTK